MAIGPNRSAGVLACEFGRRLVARRGTRRDASQTRNQDGCATLIAAPIPTRRCRTLQGEAQHGSPEAWNLAGDSTRNGTSIAKLLEPPKRIAEMIVVLAVAAGVALQSNGLKSASAHRLGHGGGVLSIGDGITRAVAEEEGHLLEVLAGLEELQAEGGAV